MATIADYIGRSVDVAAWTGQQASGDTFVTPALASPGNSGEVCTGIVKLMQRWQLEFLTISGTILFLPDRGCDFMYLLRSGQLQTTIDVEQAFYLSASQVKLNLTAEDTPTTPLDEQLASVSLLSVTLSADTLDLYVSLVSQAGESRVVILPIQTSAPAD